MKKLYSFEVKKKAALLTNCKSIEDLKGLGLDTNQLIYHALHPRYYTFEMRKKNGGFRMIEAPDFDLKQIQRRLNFYLQCLYYTIQSSASYGYIIRVKDLPYTKNILENAKHHLGALYLLNVDFEGFFHQISDQRVFQLLQNDPFRFHKKAAHTLVKIFTYKKRLPMGAPTSPVLSNLAALELDQALSLWAMNNQIKYTRFVDDLTFSSKTIALDYSHYEAIKNICEAHRLKLKANIDQGLQ